MSGLARSVCLVALLVGACSGGGGGKDAGSTDAGPTDAGPTDAGPTDAGPTDAGGGQCRLGGDCQPAADAGVLFCGAGCAQNCIVPPSAADAGGGRFCSLPCATNADCATPYGCCGDDNGGLPRKMCLVDRAGCP